MSLVYLSLLAVLLVLCQNVLADIKFTMLYVTNQVIETEQPYQIIWTGAVQLANISFVDSNGTTFLVDSYNPHTTFNWIPPAELDGHKGSLVITDGGPKDTTPQLGFKDSSEQVPIPSNTHQNPVASQTATTGAGSTPTAATTIIENQASTAIPAPTPTDTLAGQPEKSSAGAHVGLIIGFIALIGAILIMLFFLIRTFRKRKASTKLDPEHEDSTQDIGPYAFVNKFNQSATFVSPISTVQELGDKDVVRVMPVELPAEEVRGSREKFLVMDLGERGKGGEERDVEMVEDKCLRRDVGERWS